MCTRTSKRSSKAPCNSLVSCSYLRNSLSEFGEETGRLVSFTKGVSSLACWLASICHLREQQQKEQNKDFFLTTSKNTRIRDFLPQQKKDTKGRKNRTCPLPQQFFLNLNGKGHRLHSLVYRKCKT